jgi:predicted phage tail protein
MSEQSNTLENPSEFDALVKLRPNEPYFPLIGRDRLAPPLVAQWADNNRRRALAEYDDGKITREKLDQELRQSTDAEMIAASMKAYKAGHQADQSKVKSETVTYTGHTLPEEAARRDAIQRGQSRSCSAINNAVAEVVELEKAFRLNGDIEMAIAAETIAEQLRGFADVLMPQRLKSIGAQHELIKEETDGN